MAVVSLAACGSSSKKPTCTTGAERCACYGNHTCNEGLACLSDICVLYKSGDASAGTGGAIAQDGVAAQAGPDAVDSPIAGQGGIPLGGAPGNGGARTGGGATAATTTQGGAGGSSDTQAGGSDGGGVLGSGGLIAGGAPASGGTRLGSAPDGGSGGIPGGGSSSTGGTLGIDAATGEAPLGENTDTGGYNYITNGDFSEGATSWAFTPQDPGSTGEIANGAYCISAGTSSVRYTLGWPDATSSSLAFVIEPGVSYTVSFRAAATWANSITAKIGYAASPYTSLYSATVSIGTIWQTFSFQFSVRSGYDAAGLAFLGTVASGARICFDNVSVTRD